MTCENFCDIILPIIFEKQGDEILKRGFRVFSIVLFFVVLVGIVYAFINFDANRLEDVNNFWKPFGNTRASETFTT